MFHASKTRSVPTSAHDVHVRLSSSTYEALRTACASSGETLSHAVERALAAQLGLEFHSLFQVSTSGALVEGVYQGCVTVGEIKRHGDFGLGTFDGIDGEGIMLDGVAYQATSDGRVHAVSDEVLAPFWVATRFVADCEDRYVDVTSANDLYARIDQQRPSENLFVALRLRGTFSMLKVRVACKTESGVDLVTATAHQAEFTFEQITGSLVGFWTPQYARTINVPGYHLHFLSDDRMHAGHVLDLRAASLDVALSRETNVHLALPETESFLRADLAGDPSAALRVAEGERSTQ